MTYQIIILIGGFAIYKLSLGNDLEERTETRFDQDLNMDRVKKTKVKENPYQGLRDQSFSVTPDQLNLNPDESKTIIYGVVMDRDAGAAMITVVSFQTGDASMYFSTGQIFIGGFAHDNIRAAGLALVNGSQKFLTKAIATTETPLPDKNYARLYFLTNKGKYYIEEKLSAIENRNSEFSSLFELGYHIISEFRITTARK